MKVLLISANTETINMPPSYAEALCDEIISEKLNIDWRYILYPSKINETTGAKNGTRWMSGSGIGV